MGSILAFVAIGCMLPSWRDSILWIVPILLLHEFSHYLAMRRFGYRNLQMTSFPLFGAAVSGHRFNVPGWEQCVVSVASPIPSIVLAGIAGIAALRAGWHGVAEVMAMALVLNGFNLLPVYPLDGGQVIRATGFCRAPRLDAAFRAVATAAVVGLGWWGELWMLLAVGMFMAFGLPEIFRQARAAGGLRRAGFQRLSPDGETIADVDARRILAALRAGSAATGEPVSLAPRVIGTYQLLNTRPPGVWASVGFLAVQFGGLVVTLGLARWIWRGIREAGAA